MGDDSAYFQKPSSHHLLKTKPKNPAQARLHPSWVVWLQGPWHMHIGEGISFRGKRGYKRKQILFKTLLVAGLEH